LNYTWAGLTILKQLLLIELLQQKQKNDYVNQVIYLQQLAYIYERLKQYQQQCGKATTSRILSRKQFTQIPALRLAIA